MSKAASSPESERHLHDDDGSSKRGNQVMLGVLAACIASSVTMIILSGITGSVAVLLAGVVVMALAVGAMLASLSRLIGTEHETYGEA